MRRSVRSRRRFCREGRHRSNDFETENVRRNGHAWWGCSPFHARDFRTTAGRAFSYTCQGSVKNWVLPLNAYARRQDPLAPGPAAA